jgi:ribonuclease J
MTSTPKPQYNFNFTPLGGLGQIGSNMMLLESERERFIIDCGILFPYENFFDINYLIPDFEHIGPIDFIFITHGHEDHIGALPHLVVKFPKAPIYAPPFAAKLIENKLEDVEHGKIIVYKDKDEFKFKDFNISPIRVNHSIPDTYGVYICDPKFEVGAFYISDFKVDHHSPYEKPFDFKKLSQLSNKTKTKYLFADSTNILSKNTKTPSERDIIDNFDKLFQKNYKRFFISLFASNVHRLKTILTAAKKANKKVVPYGRSINYYASIATELGILEDWEKNTYDIDSIDLKQENLVFIVSGCQGEFRSTLKRVTSGQDSRVKLQEGDLLAMSSKAIPGNEKMIGLMFNDAVQANAHVYIPENDFIHVSGHAGKDDLSEVIKNFSPHYYIPIHGESLFLDKQLDFMKKNFSDIKTISMFNFDSLNIGQQYKVTQSDPRPPILIHGHRLKIERTAISQRRKMACQGTIFVSLNIKYFGKPSYQPEISLLGLPESEKVNCEELTKLIKRELNKKKNKDITEVIRVEIRRFCHSFLGYKPITIVHENT